jgi:ATP-dependent DNA helicase DinG
VATQSSSNLHASQAGATGSTRVEEIFDALSRTIPGYEYRPQQMELAENIARAFEHERPGIFEAGTGTGKTLAALIPAALSGKRVVVSTATISLQEQYIKKDIPTLQTALPQPLRAALLKGRGNYVGLRRYEEHVLSEEVDPKLIRWLDDTDDGDVGELDFSPAIETWLEINSDSDDCLRNRCKRFEECFYFRARKRAEDADILVVNHALLLADAASDGNILPNYDLLIIDEAHQMPEIATKAFSLNISMRGLNRLASRSLKNVGAPAHLVHNMEELGADFFGRLHQASPLGRNRIRVGIEQVGELLLAINTLRDWLSCQDFESVLDVDNAREKLRVKAKALISTATRFISCLELVENPDNQWVLWTEKTDMYGGKLEIIAAPLHVAQMLEDKIFNKRGLQSTVWMSATLATGGEDPFAFFKQQIGAPSNVIQGQVASPFDYPRQSVMYLPSLPEPNDPRFAITAAPEIEKILNVSNGRAFVLFTSYNTMNTIFDILEYKLPFECKKQGEMSRQRLIEWFKETPNAVLFGTSSFWEGVSIDGEQLSCVIIDRIPFQAPDDPVYEARCDALKEESDRHWFSDLALPHAIMRLKQGVGRLIRTRTDRGIVALLDARITKKMYGRTVLGCLPPMPVIKTLGGYRSLDELFERLHYD